MSFLNTVRIWAAVLLLSLLGFGSYKLHHNGYLEGKAEGVALLADFTEAALKQTLTAQIERQNKEAVLVSNNHKVTENYESLKVATGIAVSALDADRLRLQDILTAYRGSTGQVSPTGQAIDGDAIIETFSQCINEYSSVAKEADALSNQLIGLQTYITEVIQK